MSDDALATLLRKVMAAEGDPRPYVEGYDRQAAWLGERGVVVLPPGVAEVLRTGKPSRAMRDAFVEAAEVMMENEDVDAGLCAALAVLASPQRPV